MKTDPFGNTPGTIRGLLAMTFSVAMTLIVLAFVYRTQILGLPFVMPDAFTIGFFTLGGTIIGSYFGVRSGQQSLLPPTPVNYEEPAKSPAPPPAKIVQVPITATVTAGSDNTKQASYPDGSPLILPSEVVPVTAEEHLAAS